jgi:hypothetical protein
MSITAKQWAGIQAKRTTAETSPPNQKGGESLNKDRKGQDHPTKVAVCPSEPQAEKSAIKPNRKESQGTKEKKREGRSKELCNPTGKKKKYYLLQQSARTSVSKRNRAA